jgi:hypothetical protein
VKTLTRQQVVDNVQNEWGTYVKRFQSLSAEAQAAFLARQGFGRLGDLLAHVIAWWETAQRALPARLADPAFHDPDYDVDAFNARAIERFAGLDDSAVAEAFETRRMAMLDLVVHLPDAAFQDQFIVDRLHIEFLGHLQEHALPR